MTVQSEFTLSAYTQRREALLRLCQRLRREVDSLDVTLLLGGERRRAPDVIDSIRSRLVSRSFRVLIAGEFNAGKSFFINTLLNRWTPIPRPTGKTEWRGLLGVDIRPATTLLTEIRFGSPDSAIIRTKTGEEIALDLAEVPAFTDLTRFGRTAGQNAKGEDLFAGLADRLGVPLTQVAEDRGRYTSEISRWIYGTFDRVLVFVTSPILCEGTVTLIDSPGLGAVYEEHKKTTLHEMPAADAVVFLIDSGNPLSTSSLEFIIHARTYIDKLFFVQTKADHLAPDDLARCRGYNHAKLASLLGEPVPPDRYHIVSALRYRNLHTDGPLADAPADTGFPALERALSQFLATGRGDRSLSSEGHVIALIARIAKGEVDARMAAIGASREKLAEAVATIARDRDELTERKRQCSTAVLKARSDSQSSIELAGKDLLEGLRNTMGSDNSRFFAIVAALTSREDHDMRTAVWLAAHDFVGANTLRDRITGHVRRQPELESLCTELPSLLLRHLRLLIPEPDIKSTFWDRLFNSKSAIYDSQVDAYHLRCMEGILDQTNRHFDEIAKDVDAHFDILLDANAGRERSLQARQELEGADLQALEVTLRCASGNLVEIMDSVYALTLTPQ